MAAPRRLGVPATHECQVVVCFQCLSLLQFKSERTQHLQFRICVLGSELELLQQSHEAFIQSFEEAIGFSVLFHRGQLAG